MQGLQTGLTFLSHSECIGTFPLGVSYQKFQLLPLAHEFLFILVPPCFFQARRTRSTTLLQEGVAVCPSAANLESNSVSTR